MKITMVICRETLAKEEVLEQYTFEEIPPAQHQEIYGNGVYVMMQAPDMSYLFDVRSERNFNLINWVDKYLRYKYDVSLKNMLITSIS